jgi:phytoene dehydrogenase-like protein
MPEVEDRIKKQIILALRHPEADEGLYFRNFFHLHEEDERPAVQGGQEEILDALKQLISEGQVVMHPGTGEDGEVIFSLSGAH